MEARHTFFSWFLQKKETKTLVLWVADALMIPKIQTVNLMAPWWMSGMLTWVTLALLSFLWQTTGIPKLQVARTVLTDCNCVTPCQCYVWLTKDWPLIQIFVVKYEVQHQHAHCPLAWGQAGSKEYWIRSNGCKGTAVRAGSPTKSDNWTICQYLYLCLAIDIALFFSE